MEFVDSLSILDPCNWSLAGAYKLDQYRTKEINCLVKHFQGFDSGLNDFPSLGATGTKLERILVPSLMSTLHRRNSVEEFCADFSKGHQEMFPNMALLLSIAITLPVTTAGFERAFSTQKWLNTKLPGGKAGHHRSIIIGK